MRGHVKPAKHGRDHLPGGEDPVPGIGSGALSLGMFEFKVCSDTTLVFVGNDQMVFAIPEDLDGTSLVTCAAFVSLVSSAGAIEVQIRNASLDVNMLTTPITIDQGDSTSYIATTPPVIDTGNDDVSTGTLIAIDVDEEGTDALGLGVILGFA